jgi:hypothetical protein
MRFVNIISLHIGSIGLMLLFSAPVLALPTEPLSTQLSERDRLVLEQLVRLAQQNSAAVREAKVALGISAWTDGVSLELSPAYSINRQREDQFEFTESGRSFSATLSLNPLQMLAAMQQRPVLQAKRDEAIRQKRLEVLQAYVAYLQAKQTQILAQLRLQPHQTKPETDLELLAARNELFVANSNLFVALEALAVAVGQPSGVVSLLLGSLGGD